MKTIKLEECKEPYVCAVGETIEYISSDNLEYIKEYKEKGYTIYGVKKEKVLNETFIKENLKYAFEHYIDDFGYEFMNERIDYDGIEFKKVKDAVRVFIKSLGDINIQYFLDTKTIVEVE